MESFDFNIFRYVIFFYKYLNATTSNIDGQRFHREVLQSLDLPVHNGLGNNGHKWIDDWNKNKFNNRNLQDKNKDLDVDNKNDNNNYNELTYEHIISEILDDFGDECDSDIIDEDISLYSIDSNDEYEDVDSNLFENDLTEYNEEYASFDHGYNIHDDKTIEKLQAEKEMQNLQEPDWSLLYRPVALYRAIKKYHNCNWLTIAILFLTPLYLLYISSKSLLYAYLGYKYKTDRIIIHNYYRPAFHYLEPIMNAQITFWCILTYTLLIRVQFFISLIRFAIINEKKYVAIKPSQIALGYISLFNLTPSEYIKLYQAIREHDKLLIESPQFLQLHYSSTINPSNPSYRKLNRLDRIYLRYYVTLTDFGPCHQATNEYLPNSRKSRYPNWHHAHPMQLCDLTHIHYLVLCTIIGGTLITILIGLAMGTTYYMHIAYNYYNYSIGQLKAGYYAQLDNSLERIDDFLLFNKSVSIYYWLSEQQQHHHYFDKRLYKPSSSFNYSSTFSNQINDDYIPKYIPIEYLTWEFLKNKWARLENSFALLDDSFCIISQASLYVDCSCILYCVIIYYSRVDKVRKFMESLLNSIRNSNTYMDAPRINQIELNTQIIYCCEKLSLLLDEVVDMQHEWSLFIDILVMTNVVILSLNIVHFAVVPKQLCEYIFGYMLVAHSIMPLWIALIIGSSIGGVLGKICPLITALIVNEACYLNRSTIKMLLKINQHLESEQNRSFLVFRKYAVTPLFILQLIGWVTSICFVLKRITSDYNK